jgi:peptidylprolyl isomerase
VAFPTVKTKYLFYQENSVDNSKRKSGWLLAAAIILLIPILAACQPAKTTPASTAIPTAEPTKIELNVTLPAAEASTPVPVATPTLYALQGAKTTSTGLQYIEETAGSGESPKSGELITMNYIASLTDGTELANTYIKKEPVTTVWGVNRLLPGWEEGVGMMKPGGKAKFVLPAKLAFGEQGSGTIPPNSQIVLEVELLAVKAAPVPTEVAADKLTKTASGLQYYDLATGDGTESAKSRTVSTNYTVWIKTDKGYNYVDQSDTGKPMTFVIGRGDTVFAGWEEGATGMKVGGKRLLVVPPDLGMGAQGNAMIPANSTLVMEIELTDVKEPRVATKVEEKDFTTTASGLKFYDLKVGTGESPKAGQTVVVHYTGWLTDGTQFDSSVDRGEPFSFVLGAGKVIPGWDEGLLTMKVGGKRQLVIPAALGYGDQGSGNTIPPGAVLVFEVELLEIK